MLIISIAISHVYSVTVRPPFWNPLYVVMTVNDHAAIHMFVNSSTDRVTASALVCSFILSYMLTIFANVVSSWATV